VDTIQLADWPSLKSNRVNGSVSLQTELMSEYNSLGMLK
jgi:hypothetical protein